MALLIPTADAMYGRYQLKQMCAAEGGLKVYRVAQNVDGFLASSATAETLKKYGYQFMEGGGPNNYYRFSLVDGEMLLEQNVKPKSQYKVMLVKTGYKTRYWKDAYVVQDMQGEVLAEDTQISFRGGWAERFLGQFSGAGAGSVASCANEVYAEIRHIRVVTNTLKH